MFCPYKQVSSSERKSNHRKKLQKSQVNNISDSKPSKRSEVVEPEHNIFPPDPPDASLHKKIINDFCEATTKPSKCEETGCAVCGALTLQTELFDLGSLNINM